MSLSLSPRVHLDAFVHCQGVVLGKKHFPLEVTYCDRTGFWRTFRINSPLSFYETKRIYPKAIPHAIVSTTGGISYDGLLQFLRDRHAALFWSNGGTKRVVFGHKGGSYQPDVLRDAGITHLLDVEHLGVPSLSHLVEKYRHTIVATMPFCPNHQPRLKKCSALAAMLVTVELHSDDTTTVEAIIPPVVTEKAAVATDDDDDEEEEEEKEYDRME
jgi:hypothetical protein